MKKKTVTRKKTMSVKRRGVESVRAVGKVASSTFTYPVRLVKPVSMFLKDQLKRLERRKKNVEEDDPFVNSDRFVDNAAPDADAEEQFGHARTSAVKKQLEAKIKQTKRALKRIKKGKYGICEKCGKMIDTDRLKIYPEATLCVKCERERNRK